MRETTVSIKKSGVLSRRRRGALPPGQRFSHNSRAWMVWIVSLSFVLFQFFLQLSFGEMVSVVMKSFDLSATKSGVLASSYYFVYVFLQMPAGMLIDRYGPRRILSVAALVVVLGCVMFAEAPNFSIAMCGRLLMGTGAAFAFVGSLNLVSMWFPANRFGVMTALAETAGMFGSILGTLLLATFVHHVGWRYCMLFSAGLSLVLAALLWSVVRDTPDNVTLITQRSFSSWWEDVKLLFSKKIAWLNGVYSGLLFLIITVFVALWSVPFMQVSHHMSLLKATWVCDMVFVGAAIGNPVMGWIDGHLASRKLLFVLGPLVAAALLGLLLFVPQLSTPVVTVLMFMLGLSISSYVLTFVVGNELAPHGARTTSLGFVNTLSVGFAPIVGPLVGWVLDSPVSWSGHQSVLAGSLGAYQQSFTVFLVCLLVASVVGFYLPNRPAAIVEDDNLAAEEPGDDWDSVDRII